MTTYDIRTDIRFKAGEAFDIQTIIDENSSPWFNQTLARFDEAVLRLGLLHGTFHLHQHDDEDELFFVLKGQLSLEVDGQMHILGPNQGFVVPKGVQHRTSASEPVEVLMMARRGVQPTGTVSTPSARLSSVAPQFRVRNVVEVAEDYRDRLGFEIEGYFGEPPAFGQVVRDGLLVQLGQTASPDQAITEPASGVGYNAYFWVQGIEALAEEFEARKARIAIGPVRRNYGCTEIVVKDLEGRKLCFGELD